MCRRGSSPYEHPWQVTPAEAMAIQERLRPVVVTEDDLGPVRHVAGVDVGFLQGNAVARAAVVVLSFPDLQPVEQAVAQRPAAFPYVPGLLSFREAPAALAALAQLATRPDLLLCDGQGLAHPRRFGLACHIGLLSDFPAIGVAKTRLVGQHEPLPSSRGSWRPLTDDGEVIGAVLRTRDGVKPLYVSIGHRISLESAVEIVLACAPRYRLPETTRRAHRLASSC
jgi:deoxyribonuclease V